MFVLGGVLFFCHAGQAVEVCLIETCDTDEDIYDHRGVFYRTNEFFYEIPVPCAYESPVDSADDHEDARDHIHDSHKEKSEGIKVQVHWPSIYIVYLCANILCKKSRYRTISLLAMIMILSSASVFSRV